MLCLLFSLWRYYSDLSSCSFIAYTSMRELCLLPPPLLLLELPLFRIVCRSFYTISMTRCIRFMVLDCAACRLLLSPVDGKAWGHKSTSRTSFQSHCPWCNRSVNIIKSFFALRPCFSRPLRLSGEKKIYRQTELARKRTTVLLAGSVSSVPISSSWSFLIWFDQLYDIVNSGDNIPL